jgi:DNA-binding IclR family transcriptional regulator
MSRRNCDFCKKLQFFVVFFIHISTNSAWICYSIFEPAEYSTGVIRFNMNTDENSVKSIAKAFHILSCFNATDTQLSLTDICKKTGMPKSTTLNILRTLEQFGYITRTVPSMNYRLGYSVMKLNYYAQMATPVVRYTSPFLEDLQRKTGKTIYLTTHIDGRVLYLDVAHQNRRMFSYSIAGKTLHMHCTGCGKAMLSYLPAPEVEQIIQSQGLPAFTPNTITDKTALLKELEEIRSRGYALDNEEETLGVRCIAEPILNSKGYPTAAISISGSALSMQPDMTLDYAKELTNTCNALSHCADEYPAGQILLLQKRKG